MRLGCSPDACICGDIDSGLFLFAKRGACYCYEVRVSALLDICSTPCQLRIVNLRHATIANYLPWADVLF